MHLVLHLHALRLRCDNIVYTISQAALVSMLIQKKSSTYVSSLATCLCDRTTRPTKWPADPCGDRVTEWAMTRDWAMAHLL